MGRRVAVIGGTRFVGLAAVRRLVHQGDHILVAHRGEHLLPPEPDLTGVGQAHGPRDELLTEGGPVEQFRPDVVVDTFGPGASRDNAQQLVAAATRAGAERIVVTSSCDVYQAAVEGGLGDGSGRVLLPTTPLPISEDAPLRSGPYPGARPGHDNVAMEGGLGGFPGSVVILRPGTIYGPGDEICREWPLIRRARDGIRSLPLPNGGTQLLHRVSVERVAGAIAAAVHAGNLAPRFACNVADPYDWTYAGLAAEIASQMDWEWEPEVVPFQDALHPWRIAHPMVMSDLRLRTVLGVGANQPDPREALARTIDWYLSHGPNPESPYLDW